MELVAELWEKSIKVKKACMFFLLSFHLFGGSFVLISNNTCVYIFWQAEFVPTPDPSLTEQYEYANEHEIKCLVIITEPGVTQNQIEFVKVRKKYYI